MRVIYKEPYKRAKVMNVENSLDGLQGLIDGQLEVAWREGDYILLCDGEGKLKELEPNLKITGEIIVGPVAVVCVDGDEFCDLPEDMDRLVVDTLTGWAIASMDVSMYKGNVAEKAIAKYGEEHQLLKAIEELSELQRAICRIMMEPGSEEARDNLLEERADVAVILEQVDMILDVGDEWDEAKAWYALVERMEEDETV